MRVLQHVAGFRLAKRGEKIVIFRLPFVGGIGLAKPAGGPDEGAQADQIPVGVRVFRLVVAPKSAINKARRNQAVVQRRAVLQGLLAELLDILGDPLQLWPLRFQPDLVLGELGVPDAGPEHDAVLLRVVLHDFDATVGLLVGQFIGHAAAGLVAGAEHGRRLQQKRAVDDPQAAVAGRPDLERR